MLRSRLVGFVALFALFVSTGARAQDVVRLGLAVPNNSFYAATFAAEKLGFFKDANLKVEITEYRGGAVAQEALTAGAADMITYFAPGVGLAVSKGAKERIVAAIGPVPYAWAFLVNADTPYKSVKEMSGKKVGITAKASTSDMLALWAAEREGVTIQTVPLGSGAIPALRAKQVDAVVINPPLSLLEVSSGRARNLVDFEKVMDPMLPDVFVASQEMIDKRPEVLRKVLAAIYKGLNHMRTDRKFGLEFIKAYTKAQDDKTSEMIYEASTMKQSPDGRIDRKWVVDSINTASKLWNMPELAKVNVDDLFTDKFAPGAGK